MVRPRVPSSPPPDCLRSFPCGVACSCCADGLAVPADLGTNFFLSAASVGQPRAAASLPQLQDLNKTVDVVVHSGSITHELIAAHNVVVFTQGWAAGLVYLSRVCCCDGVACVLVCSWVSESVCVLCVCV